MECLVDYVSFTLPSDWGVPWVQTLLGGTSDWDTLEGGYRGYTNSAQWGHIRIGWGGQGGIHCNLSGQGCRELDAEYGRTWAQNLAEWLQMGAKFTRIDFAYDDKAGLLDMEEVVASVREGRVCSRAKKYEVVESGSIGEVAGRVGRTVYVGRGACETSVRIYDKAAQMEEEGPWVRVELQLRGGRAQAAAELVVAEGVGAVVGLLEAACSFRACHKRSEAYRSSVVGWWSEFVQAACAVKLVVKAKVRTVNDLALWFVNSMSGTVATLWRAGFRSDLFTRMCKEGEERRKSTQKLMLRHLVVPNFG